MNAGIGTHAFRVHPTGRLIARITLAVLVVLPFLVLSFVQLRHPHAVAFFGATHRLGLIVLYVMVAIVVFAVICVLGLLLVIVALPTIGVTLAWLWAEAFHEYNPTWVSRWKRSW